MTWIAVSDGRRAAICPNEDLHLHGGNLVPRGSLIVEALFSAGEAKPQTVVHMDRHDGWRRRFRIVLSADGEVRVEHWQGTVASYARLHLHQPDRDAVLRLVYSWDAPARLGLLSVENLDTGRIDQASFDEPQPLALDDIAVLAGDPLACARDPSVSLLAVSTEIEPVGLPLGYCVGTRVSTTAGPRLIETLQPGELVQTAQSELQPVRGVLLRQVPAFGQFAPVRLRHPFPGLHSDLNVAPMHRMLIEGADAEYLFGIDAVLVEARHLARGFAGPRRRLPGTVTYAQVVLDVHDCMQVSGAWGESLYLDRSTGADAWLESRIRGAGAGGAGGHLPRHDRIANPLLKGYEAMVLMSAMSA